MSAYKTLTLTAANTPLKIREQSPSSPKAGEVTVRLKAAALNHRDLWIQKGQYANVKFPLVPGSDGAGVVEQVGGGVDPKLVGASVIINPALDWGDSPEAMGKDFRILGLPEQGTFAEWIKVPAANLAPMPAHLGFEEAAALPLAGLTAWRALFTRGRLQAGEKVLITGIGGGVALFLLRFALAAEARVWVTSGSPDKLQRAKAIGALGGANYRDEKWAESLAAEAGQFDLIVDSAGGPGFAHLCDLARPGGRLVFFGATAGNPPELPLRKVFWRQLNLLGTTMGSPQDFAAMVAFVAERGLRPVIDGSYAFDQADEALRRMDAGGQFGKLVITM
jgi:zinc-binding alcohol dehydrogenase/oxidoreductase